MTVSILTCDALIFWFCCPVLSFIWVFDLILKSFPLLAFLLTFFEVWKCNQQNNIVTSTGETMFSVLFFLQVLFFLTDTFWNKSSWCFCLRQVLLGCGFSWLNFRFYTSKSRSGNILISYNQCPTMGKTNEVILSWTTLKQLASNLCYICIMSRFNHPNLTFKGYLL